MTMTLNPNDCTNCRFTRFGNVSILLINLLIPCWLSQKCINTYASINRIIHNVRCGTGNRNPEWLSNILREYVLQMEHLKLRFSCNNFFDINLKSFGGMVLTIITYSIILIQFKLKDLVEAKPKSLTKAH
ncbi:putative gustatory receptor 98b [Drosophila navojoa]|uniref:putative gustatory receptor 98b n=1 Tax=Drosophila navojoa TaxID=7232 RepID=UPI0011BFCBF6|nr:putative gustatory receptor 98b [Drosophila navojoa]